MKTTQNESVKNVFLFLLVLMSLSFIGCSMVGRVIPDDKRILLSDQEKGGGTFHDGGCTVEYSYRLTGDSMIIQGQAYYRRSVDLLDVRAMLLDTSGTVLDEKLVYASGYRESRGRGIDRSFKETLIVPPGSTGITFSCSVQERSSRP